MNDVLKVIDDRVSCRNFSDKDISEDLLNQILDAGLKAPSGGDFQPYSVIVIRDRAKRKRLAELSRNQNYVAKAPISLLFLVDWRRVQRMCQLEPAPFEVNNKTFDMWMTNFDVALAAQNMCIAAESLGLKSIYIGNVFGHLDEVTEMFNIPKYVLPSMLLCLGYPKSKLVKQKKYNRSVIVHNEQYQDMSDELLIQSFKDKYEGWQIKVSAQKQVEFLDKCEHHHGLAFRKRAQDYLEKNKKLNFYQFWLGIFYSGLEDQMTNDDYKRYFKKQGFDWL